MPQRSEIQAWLALQPAGSGGGGGGGGTICSPDAFTPVAAASFTANPFNPPHGAGPSSLLTLSLGAPANWVASSAAPLASTSKCTDSSLVPLSRPTELTPRDDRTTFTPC
ncbi:unnamed protein product, partial [Protopolystoma xenopodis]